jgi:hypothetical protein
MREITITKYESEDGRLFENSEQCQEYERFCDCDGLAKGLSGVLPSDLARCLYAHAAEIRKLLDKWGV